MAYKKINGIEVIERGGSTVSVAWLKSMSEGQAVRCRSGVDRNNTVAMWKEVRGYSVPNYASEEPTRSEVLMKVSKYKLSEMATDLEIDFESDSNKKAIVKLIVENENSED